MINEINEKCVHMSLFPNRLLCVWHKEEMKQGQFSFTPSEILK